MRHSLDLLMGNRARVLPSADAMSFLWWFATLLGLSCIFKLNYLKYVYNIPVMIHHLFEPAGILDRAFYFDLIFSKDVIEVFFIVTILYLIGRRLLHWNFNALMLITTALLLLIAGANLLSFEQLRSPLTLENIWISISWALSDPTIVKNFVWGDAGNALLSTNVMISVLTILAWSISPVFISEIRKFHHIGDQEKLRVWLTRFFALLIFVAAGVLSMVYRPLPAKAWWILGGFVVVMSLASYQLRRSLPWVGIAGRLRPYATSATALLVISCSLFYFIGFRDFERTPLALEGHWSTIATSLFTNRPPNYDEMAVPTVAELRQRYHALAYPQDDGSAGGDLLTLPADRVKPRHVVIVSLETAFQDYYRLFDDPDLPHFHRMSERALVSELHHTPTPFTVSAAFSMLTGLYPRLDAGEGFSPDSLPNVLARYGYESTYIDSYLIDWLQGSKHRRLFETLGFDRLRDISTDEDLTGDEQRHEGYQHKVRLEQVAFERALAAIRDAEGEGRLALVFVQTGLGHFPWLAAPGRQDDQPEAKIRDLIRELDRFFGVLLGGLDGDGLTDDVIIAITGDHGLRYSKEFETLGLQLGHSDVAFNVPLIISAPGLFEEQVRVPYVTSHIDLAPTLLAMMGIPADALFHHGENLLDRKVSERVTFLLNTNLSPVDGFHWNNHFITYDHMSGMAQIARGAERSDLLPLAEALDGGAALPASLAQPQTAIDSANEIVDLTIAHFIRGTPQQ